MGGKTIEVQPFRVYGHSPVRRRFGPPESLKQGTVSEGFYRHTVKWHERYPVYVFLANGISISSRQQKQRKQLVGENRSPII